MKTHLLKLTCWTVLLAGILWGAVASGQETEESIKSSLRSNGAAWYDANSDSVRFEPLPSDAPGLSTNRDRLKEAPFPTRTRTTAAAGGLDWLSPQVIWIFLGVLLALFLVIAILLIGRIKSSSRVERETPVDDQTRMGNLPIEVDRSVKDFRQAALQAAARGDFRAAIIWLYSHSLVAMDRNNVIELRKGKTNRQYLAELLTALPGGTIFRSMVLDFESVYFGGNAADVKDFERFLNSSDSLEKLSASATFAGGTE